ncbi:MAG: CARDB domain-containing protein [Cyanobacteria bacterium P01_F01_bin.143]
MTTISANNEIIHGFLALDDDLNPNRLDAVKDDYSLVDLTPGQTITIDLFSEEFDAYLQLINSDTGAIIFENDDFNETSNSQLRFIPEDHVNYLVRVTSYGSSETGNYTLSSDNEIDVDLVIEDANVTIVTNNELSNGLVPSDSGDHLAYNTDFSYPYYYYDDNYINLDLSLTVKNQGTETAFRNISNNNYYYDDYYYYGSGWNDTVYLSNDQHFDPYEDLWVADFWRDEDLEAGESYTTKFEANLYKPNLWGRDDHYLIFVTDSNDAQYETDEHNNTFAVPIDLNLTPPDVDLIVTDGGVIATPYYNGYGETYLDLSLSIMNQGTEPTLGLGGYDYYYGSNLYSAVYISSDQHFDPAEDSWVADFWHGESLGAGESQTAYTTGYLYDYQLEQPGDKYLIFVADSYNYQYETDEHNNTFTIPLDLNVTLPDVDLVAIDAHAELGYFDEYYGEAFLNLSFTVANHGSEATNSYGWSDTVYLSSDEYFDPLGDYWLADLWYEGASVAPGDSYTTEYFGAYVSVAQLNALKSGELNLLFVSNQYGGQYESDQTNNSLLTSLDGVLDTPIYRYQNQDIPGTYLFLGEEEASEIHANFPNFVEEGMAFKVGNESQEDLIGMYRFQSIILPGTYIYVGEEERASINQNYSDSFVEEGLSFYVYGAGEGRGTTFYRFRNTDPNLDSNYLFAAGEEAEYIRNNFPDFVEEGAAFEALI